MEKEVKFKSGNVQLSGTIQLPDALDPTAMVLLLPGSGQTDRNDNVKKLPINALKVIAEYLATNKVATFRYDKRGMGNSAGDYWRTGFYDRISDASSALTYLKSQPQFAVKPIFVLGHSNHLNTSGSRRPRSGWSYFAGWGSGNRRNDDQVASRGEWLKKYV
jgi:alpha-beta hydrolase superfamily lysophospholipase